MVLPLPPPPLSVWTTSGGTYFMRLPSANADSIHLMREMLLEGKFYTLVLRRKQCHLK